MKLLAAALASADGCACINRDSMHRRLGGHPQGDRPHLQMKRAKQIEVAARDEVERRSREIQLLLNIIEPDPEYQAFLITDEASLLDVTGASPELVRSRLEFYFRRPLPFAVTTPLWQLVDALKLAFPGWPDDWSPEDH